MGLSPVPAQIFFLIAVVSLAGCTWSPAKQSWPTPPEAIVKYPPPVLAPDPAKYQMISIATEHANGLRSLIVDQSIDRQNRDWATSDFTSIGVVGAVAGALAGQTGLLNTGAGMSVLGVSTRERYQYTNQQAAYAGAQNALDCMLTTIQSTNDTYVAWAGSQTGSQVTAEAAHALPGIIVAATTKVRLSLITRLGAISSEPIKASELGDAYRAQKAAQDRKKEASQELKDQADADRVVLDRLADPSQKANILSTDTSDKLRIDTENALVPLVLRDVVGVNIVGMEAKITECTAGY
ncbi:Serine/threonine protein kinase with pentapeptide repeats [Pseudomonas chlororaphis subsp. aurantiaca]|jgi:hypothetical protein|uniref:hypothetical protein n=1 Tax=Pseudomonas chlororaphis TaxID=587753 RepID=UPI00086528AD|nr:hypothetical protein [Pseudomonas chlororaphis]QHC90166.1 hypothetical protein PchlR47_18185 [Pseudomonas chlororaphis]BAV74889.1 Serine/threonine protein kinase with pentapeptide repeats [Pseudomonas chlororaphis subsp. aurantiaca]